MLSIAVASFGSDAARTGALVNVAVALTQNGRRVLCSSLEPQSFAFDRLLCDGDDDQVRALRELPGLYDHASRFLNAVLSSDEIDTQRATDLVTQIRDLNVLRGGPPLPGSESRLRTARDWDRFIRELGGDVFFQKVRADLDPAADYLLMDCGRELDDALARSYITEAADVLLMPSSYDDVETAPMYHFLDRDSPDCGLPQRDIPLLPVPAGVDVLTEKEMLVRGRENFRDNFGRFLPEGLDENFFAEAEIPRMPYYERVQKIALLDKPTDRFADVLFRYLAGVIERNAERWTRAPASPETIAQRFAMLPARRWWNVFLSYASEDVEAVRALRAGLTRAGLRSFLSDDDITDHVGTGPWLDAIDSVLQRSRVLVVVYSPSAKESQWVTHEYATYLRLCEESQRAPGVVAICTGGLTPEDLPAELRKYQVLRGIDAEALLRLLRGVTRSAS